MSQSCGPRAIPSIDLLKQRADAQALIARYGEVAVLGALREAAARLRVLLLNAAHATPAPSPSEPELAQALVESAHEWLRLALTPSLGRAINATGVILHTNLGRAPLGSGAVDAMSEVARGYSTLEYDTAAGGRGARHRHAERLLVALTGAEAATVVNNNAAATLLLLSALARGREVVISRGELVEIGGGFRVPDIMAQSGATLREVGTTNRTRVSDYAAALGSRTALILRVHPSNFRVEGFTERPDLSALAALAHEHGVPLVEDLGSGYLGRGPAGWRAALSDEPSVLASLAAGVDLLCFSGDKLLGGPQAGILVGRETLVADLRRHPLMRALRVDKLGYAALERTLLAWATDRAAEDNPTVRMTLVSREEIAERITRVLRDLTDVPGLQLRAADGFSTIGGGSAPGVTLPTCLLVVALADTPAAGLEARLRALPVPVVARIERNELVLDLRTVQPREDAELVEALRSLAP